MNFFILLIPGQWTPQKDWVWIFWLSTLLDLWKYFHCFLCLKSLPSSVQFSTLNFEWKSWLPPWPRFPFVDRWCSYLPSSSSHSWERYRGPSADRLTLWETQGSWFSWWWPCWWMGSPTSGKRSHGWGRWRWQGTLAKKLRPKNILSHRVSSMDGHFTHWLAWLKNTTRKQSDRLVMKVMTWYWPRPLHTHLQKHKYPFGSLSLLLLTKTRTFGKQKSIWSTWSRDLTWPTKDKGQKDHSENILEFWLLWKFMKFMTVENKITTFTVTHPSINVCHC